ncbi:hypothetical protein K0M31_010969 [Melipona bicolor]|uniref:Uncharacterized protein n=1 Tax=Melipona bicolor TaxID=60889 RepID=A0AA40KHR3_9HYME|nr:hypothetical protein K0M31_010969 [Melipona bicolor]
MGIAASTGRKDTEPRSVIKREPERPLGFQQHIFVGLSVLALAYIPDGCVPTGGRRVTCAGLRLRNGIKADDETGEDARRPRSEGNCRVIGEIESAIFLSGYPWIFDRELWDWCNEEICLKYRTILVSRTDHTSLDKR